MFDVRRWPSRWRDDHVAIIMIISVVPGIVKTDAVINATTDGGFATFSAFATTEDGYRERK